MFARPRVFNAKLLIRLADVTISVGYQQETEINMMGHI